MSPGLGSPFIENSSPEPKPALLGRLATKLYHRMFSQEAAVPVVQCPAIVIHAFHFGRYHTRQVWRVNEATYAKGTSADRTNTHG